MTITLDELYQGLPCLIKNKEFYSPKAYVEPFIERLSKLTDKFTIQIKEADQLSTANKAVNKVYNRVVVQAILPEANVVDNHAEVIGMVYGIDVKKPVVKIYKGYENRVCTNLCVFEPQWINMQELIPGDPINFNPVQELLEYTSNFKVKLKELKDTYIDRDSRKRYLGEWVDYALREHQDYGFGKVKIAVSTPIDAYKELFINQESEYYVPQGIDPNLYDIYNAFTQVITDDSRDLLNKFEKTIIVGRLLKII